MTGVEKAARDFRQEVSRQIDIVYGAAEIALYREYGFKKRLVKVFESANDVFMKECGLNQGKSVPQLLEEVTDINLKVDENGRSWHELAVFNYDMLNKRYRHQTPAMQILMYQQQKKWMGVCLMSALLVSLARNYGFGQKRLLRIMNDVAEVEKEFSLDGRKLVEEGKRLTGVQIFKDK